MSTYKNSVQEFKELIVFGEKYKGRKPISKRLYMDSRVVEKSQSKITSLAEMCAE